MSTGAHRELIARLFPQLALRSFDQVPGGWTCDTYRVDDEWIVQLPRTAYAEERLRRQIELLPELGREVSATVPLPELVSLDPVCMGYRALPGIACDILGDDGVWPERLGRFLYDLHMVPPEYLGMRAASASAVRDVRRSRWSEPLGLVTPHITDEEARAISASVAAVLGDDAMWRFAPCVTHGDLVPEHVLVTPTGDLAGILDWEEVAVDDPALDFAWWLHGSSAVGERALAAYGGAPDAGFELRARLAYVWMPLHDLAHGLEAGLPDLAASGVAAFRARMSMLGAGSSPGL